MSNKINRQLQKKILDALIVLPDGKYDWQEDKTRFKAVVENGKYRSFEYIKGSSLDLTGLKEIKAEFDQDGYLKTGSFTHSLCGGQSRRKLAGDWTTGDFSANLNFKYTGYCENLCEKHHPEQVQVLCTIDNLQKVKHAQKVKKMLAATLALAVAVVITYKRVENSLRSNVPSLPPSAKHIQNER